MSSCSPRSSSSELPTETPARQLVREPRGGVEPAEIERHHLRPGRPGGTDRVRDRVQPVLAARRDHQFVPVGGKHAGERFADSGRGAGDQGDGPER
jgi:hypothetical protein